MKSLFMLALFWPLGLTFATQQNITCYHTQVCNLIHYLAPAAKLDIIELPKNSDPHHYELTGGDLKKILSAKLFISPDIHLTPWLSQALKQRNPLSTITLKNLKGKRPQEAYAHFWLYQEGLCGALEFLKNALVEKNIAVEKRSCAELRIDLNLPENKKSLLVMTHDSLLPLATELGLPFLSARSSAHEHDVSTKTLKEIALKTRNTPTIWIMENQIKIPTTLLSLVKKDDKVIKINTTGSLFETPGETLRVVVKELRSDK